MSLEIIFSSSHMITDPGKDVKFIFQGEDEQYLKLNVELVAGMAHMNSSGKVASATVNSPLLQSDAEESYLMMDKPPDEQCYHRKPVSDFSEEKVWVYPLNGTRRKLKAAFDDLKTDFLLMEEITDRRKHLLEDMIEREKEKCERNIHRIAQTLIQKIRQKEAVMMDRLWTVCKEQRDTLEEHLTDGRQLINSTREMIQQAEQLLFRSGYELDIDDNIQRQLPKFTEQHSQVKKALVKGDSVNHVIRISFTPISDESTDTYLESLDLGSIDVETDVISSESESYSPIHELANVMPRNPSDLSRGSLESASLEIEQSGQLEIDKRNPDLSDIVTLDLQRCTAMVVTDFINKSVKYFYYNSGGSWYDVVPMKSGPLGVTKTSVSAIAVTLPESRQMCFIEMYPELRVSSIYTPKEYYKVSLLNSTSLVVSATFPNAVDIIDFNGTIVKSISSVQLHQKIFERPYHVSVTPSGDMLISDNFLKALVCIRVTGRVRWVYKAQTMGSPQGVACDSSGMIFLADGTKNVVIQLSSDGQFQQNIIKEEDGLHLPVAVHVHESGRIYVTQKNGTIKVFSTL
ncbi:uncharacterized protein LOC121370447 isoform X2 [Gigantopelta aegis]|uniref:uncharacterized protein LOC121370447 isoform X2 n=1 Tax=Gigantopelta aegis TaxID=1735272 RepID=UPI001B8885B2|nr:uncharacterized protein LOC121370447 isoform X2 [Gigantopelta aegis]